MTEQELREIEVWESDNRASYQARLEDVLARDASAIIWYPGAHAHSSHQRSGWACYARGRYLRLILDQDAALSLVRQALGEVGE